MNIYEFHKSNPDIFTQITLRDQLFCHYKCPQKEQIVQLYSNHNQLSFTIQGKRALRHGNKKWVLNSGQGILLKRGAFVQELLDNYADWEVLSLYLKDNYLKQVFEEFRVYLPLKNLPEVDVEMIQEFSLNDQIHNSYESLLPYFARPHLLPDSILEGKFKELLFNILTYPPNSHILAYINQITSDYIVPIWQVMEANYFYDLTISEFAEIANRSTTTFRRDFEAHYHTTPGKWLTNKRLEKSRLLLETSKKTISEIIFDCGFKNISHFSKIFKEKFNLSPTQYRTTHQKQGRNP